MYSVGCFYSLKLLLHIQHHHYSPNITWTPSKHTYLSPLTPSLPHAPIFPSHYSSLPHVLLFSSLMFPFFPPTTPPSLLFSFFPPSCSPFSLPHVLLLPSHPSCLPHVLLFPSPYLLTYSAAGLGKIMFRLVSDMFCRVSHEICAVYIFPPSPPPPALANFHMFSPGQIFQKLCIVFC